MKQTASAAIRARLKHPVIDGDGHIAEILPVLVDYLHQVGGDSLASRFMQLINANSPYGDATGWYGMTAAQRQANRIMRPPFWLVNSANPLERATTMLPALIRDRMDDFGIDFAVMYTSVGIPIATSDDTDLRLGGCRALNLMYRDIFAPHRDRMLASAVIPMHTPDEAVAEIRHAVQALGFKTVTIAGCVRRPIAAAQGSPAARHAHWIDPLVVDSLYDYDPVWRICQDLGVSVATHHSGMGPGWGSRATTTNFMYNHIGHFAAGADASCKAMFMGGVTRRFPKLNIAFLEGGAGWAASLINDITEHWEKRQIRELRAHRDPALLDRAGLAEMFRRHGAGIVKGDRSLEEYDSVFLSKPGADPDDQLDEWAAAGIARKADIGARFLPNFYFGCEADDRMNGVAFDPRFNPFGAKLNAFLGSDINHWDVPDPTVVVAEAWELVEKGVLTESDFRAFTCGNVHRLHAGMNADFFQGTSVAGFVP